MVDVASLADTATTLLAPALPYLLEVSKATGQEIVKKLGTESAWAGAQALWKKLRPAVKADRRALPEAEHVAKYPEDGQILQRHLERLLAADDDLAREVETIVERYQATVTGDGAIAQDHSVAAGRDGIAAGRDFSGRVEKRRVEAKNGGFAAGGNMTVIVREDTPRQEKMLPATSPATLRQAYLHYVFEDVRELALGGIDRAAANRKDAQLHLDAVYTALLTHSAAEPGEVREAPRAHSGEGRRRSALELLDREPRLVLLGDPGSGKSTFVHFVTLCMAGELLGEEGVNLKLLTAPLPDDDGSDQETSQAWDRPALLPVRIVLRDFVSSKEAGLPPPGEPGKAQHLLRFLEKQLEAATLGDFFPHLKTELREPGGVLLVDGLDEVPEAETRRRQIRQVLEDFARAYRSCRILVTSRTYAYQNKEWRLRRFKDAVLAPFTPGQIRRFIHRWYAHVGERRPVLREQSTTRADDLTRAVLGSARLKALAERPLLLTLMASLHAWRGGKLPQERERLYEEAVELLLDTWDRDKRPHGAEAMSSDTSVSRVQEASLSEWMRVDQDQIRRLLERLAFEAHEGQRELAGTADLPQERLVAGLLALGSSPDLKPARLLEYLENRAGLLLERGEGVYTLPHRTFQEYLAACHLTGPDFPDKVARLGREAPSRWREVVLLAGAKAARGTASSVWELVEALCYRGVPEVGATVEEEDLWGAQLAGELLVEVAVLGSVAERNRPRLERVRGWLARLLRSDGSTPAAVALERARAGRSLAALGDPRPQVLEVDAIELCRVPKGKFWMGSEVEEAFDDEMPEHELELGYDYGLGRYPVTNGQYRAFVKSGGYGEARFWEEAAAEGRWRDGRFDDRSAPSGYGLPYGHPNHPVVGVSWYEALAFCLWLTARWQSSGALAPEWTVGLPSEAEWEKGARGGLEVPLEAAMGTLPAAFQSGSSNSTSNEQPRRQYPWGEEYDKELSNTESTEIGTSSALGCFSRGSSPYGCEEMSGNVWEWTRSLWGEDLNEPERKYPYRPDDGRELTTASSKCLRVLRGGSFLYHQWGARCSYRLRISPWFGHGNLGFRVAVLPFSLFSEASGL